MVLLMKRNAHSVCGIVLIIISILYLIFSVYYIHSVGEYLHFDQIVFLKFIAYSTFTLILAVAVRETILGVYQD